MFYLNCFNPVYAQCISPEKKAIIQNLLEVGHYQYHIPGIAISVNCSAREPNTELTYGFSQLGTKKRLTSEHLFQIGSTTKSFIAVLLLQLEAEGRLSIHDLITQWFPEMSEVWKGITIQQILNHSSGIYNYTDKLELLLEEDEKSFDRQWSMDELINFALNEPLYFTPGSSFHYSNTNYIIAGKIIETVTRHSLEQELISRFFNHLQLNSTHYWPIALNQQQMQGMAHGYYERGRFSQEPYDVTNQNLSWANAAGAIVSNTHDLAIWFGALMRGELLPEEQMQELKQTISTNSALPNASPENSYGLGVMHDPLLFGEDIWWHTGGTLGYSTFMLWLHERDLILTVTLSHVSTDPDLYWLTKDILTHLIAS